MVQLIYTKLIRTTHNLTTITTVIKHPIRTRIRTKSSSRKTIKCRKIFRIRITTIRISTKHTSNKNTSTITTRARPTCGTTHCDSHTVIHNPTSSHNLHSNHHNNNNSHSSSNRQLQLDASNRNLLPLEPKFGVAITPTFRLSLAFLGIDVTTYFGII